jgi:FMN-dependent oxidoreductase (nitrilotriacetate monooxygenase family)
MTKPLHLGWFLSGGFGPKSWRAEFGQPDPWSWGKGELVIDLARAIERASFDYLMLEDSSSVPYTYQGRQDTYLRYAFATPKLEPSLLAATIFRETTHLGVISTLSTSEHHPFQLSRIVNTLDHLSGGRAGWNIVTGSNDSGAQNYGRDRHLPHDERYDQADEFTDIVTRLWDSWDEDAVLFDREGEWFADPAKVHPIDYEGKWFRSRGPLGAPRGPQGRPVICQAGGSARGRTFAARWAETIVGSASSIEKFKAFRDDVRRQAEGFGRDPDSIKVLFSLSPIVDETEQAALLRRDLEIEYNRTHLDVRLANLSRTSGIDFSQFELDQRLGKLESNGHQTLVAQYEGRTVREIANSGRRNPISGLDLVGTPKQVANRLAEIAERSGSDGFLFAADDINRKYVIEITEGLIPEMQRLGLARRRYTQTTLRGHLNEFRTENGAVDVAPRPVAAE